MGKFFLYNHGGSENHGCEALVRTVCSLFTEDEKLTVYSESVHQDYHYDLNKIANIDTALRVYPKLSFGFLKAYLAIKIKHNYYPMDMLPYLRTIKKLKKGDIELSVGGDIYCYDYYPKFIGLHKKIKKKGCKSILLGCSLEESLFQDPAFIEDMKSYDYVSARESLTYDLLKKNGIKNIGLTPDSAFTLPQEQLPLPDSFIEGDTIGLNVSPLVEKKEVKQGAVFANYKSLISYIIENTDSNVALIPHVIWENNDDRTILKKLCDEFEQTGRVVLIEDCNCMQLKGYISRCRMFIGARTHATIAAYSTGVPTLVVGYSIKSKGIAKDLFGTYENYVIPVDQLVERDDLLNAYKWLCDHECQIREKLQVIMPEYIMRVNDIKYIKTGIK